MRRKLCCVKRLPDHFALVLFQIWCDEPLLGFRLFYAPRKWLRRVAVCNSVKGTPDNSLAVSS